ncbi:MAG: TerB family tellurite resistance protein [Sphingobacterium sp.]
MKRLLLLLIGVCCLQLHLVSAQSAEVQQLLLNVEKLAQFKQILSDMKKGYQVTYKGYNAIKNISQRNFNLHNTFLDGLLKVNPEIARYRKVAEIIRLQSAILSEYKSAYRRLTAGGRFRPEEIRYLQQVYKNLFYRSVDNLEELAMILTASKLRMSDEERLRSIDRLYEDMGGKLVFLRRFNKQATALDHNRAKAQSEQELIKKMYGK